MDPVSEGNPHAASTPPARPGGYYWWRGACYYRYPNGAWSPPMGSALLWLLSRIGVFTK